MGKEMARKTTHAVQPDFDPRQCLAARGAITAERTSSLLGTVALTMMQSGGHSGGEVAPSDLGLQSMEPGDTVQTISAQVRNLSHPHKEGPKRSTTLPNENEQNVRWQSNNS